MVYFSCLINPPPMRNFILPLLCLSALVSFAQKNQTATAENPAQGVLQGMRWRSIGPWRGGRSLAVTGLRHDRLTYYMGAVGGGIWKTTDGGSSWNCVSDSTFHSSSVGALAVAPSNQNIIYAGTGETEMRNNISFGDGIYKSSDAGQSWKHIGLENSYAVGTIAVDPGNADLVYVAAQGNVWVPNKERGLYRSRNGGATWEQVLYINDSVGCCDLKIDPTNPLILYATMWRSFRTPYALWSGGRGCGLYKSTDGGNTWINLSMNAGLPTGMDGKITVSVSPLNGQHLFALVENQANGGLYQSYDGGEHWSQMNSDHNLKQRPWYFFQLFADTKTEDMVYVLNVQFWRVTNGQPRPENINNHHGDNHDLWIDPDDDQRMILGNDGGAEISTDGGQHWTEEDLPTGQFYHVNLDNDVPYHIYGDQQDNSSIRIASKTDGYAIGKNDWEPVSGGESGYIVPDPLNSHVTYGGEYDGNLSTYNDLTHESQDVSPYPVAAIGSGSAQKKYRFQWTYPICFSPNNPKELYVCSQYVHRSLDGGHSWTIISPDLTRHDSLTMLPSGGPITKDNTGAEIYADIFAFAESPVKAGVLWAGSDDGLIHVSEDGGQHWSNVTPPASLLPDFAMISIIDPSHFDAGTVYVAATRYKSNDRKPYLLKSADYGKTWQLLNNGIPADEYTRAIREDPTQPGLLYAGTERGIYISLNDGQLWQRFSNNLPCTPVHDIQVQHRDHDLVIATHGRGFWVLDDLTPVYQLKSMHPDETGCHLFQPDTSLRTAGGSYYNEHMQQGENAPNGVAFHYYFKNKMKKEVRLLLLTAAGDTIRNYSSQKNEDGDPVRPSKEFYEDKNYPTSGALRADSGLNTFVWDMRWPDPVKLKQTSPMWSGSDVGPIATPGNYIAKMFLGDSLLGTTHFVIKEDPRYAASQADLEEQLGLLKQINKEESALNKALNDLRDLREQVQDYEGKQTDTAFLSRLKKISGPMLDTLQKVEDALIQHKAKAGQDLLNYPIRLNDQLAGIGSAVSSCDRAPTQQSYIAFHDVSALIDNQLAKLQKVQNEQVPLYNKLAAEKQTDAIKGGSTK